MSLKHIRIPVTTGHPEAGWFGYLYLWQAQSNGAVGTRLHMNDPLSSQPREWFWEDAIGVDAIGYDNIVPLEQDAMNIIHDHYPRLRVVGTVQVKSGRVWS